MEHRNDKISQLLRKKYYSWIFSHIPKQKYTILDVGAGTGKFSKWARKKGHAVTSIDKESIKPEIEKLSLEEVGFHVWDLVWCSHVLEHQENHFEFAKQLMEKTKKYLIVVCPTPARVFWNEPTHIRPYTAIGLERLFCEYNKTKCIKKWEWNLREIVHTCGIILEKEG